MIRSITALFTASLSLIPIGTQAKPNILLILADDMGLDASACYKVGSQQAKMPTIETLCAQGLVFDNAYAAPVCSPTRAMIMTGKYGFRTGIGAAVGGQNGLSDKETSLFDVMSGAGYATNLIGKWHLAGRSDGNSHPAKLGVRDHFGTMGGGVKDYSNWRGVDHGRSVQVTEYATTAFTDRSIDWIAEQKNPWFLWLSYNAAHTPFHKPPSHLHSIKGLSGDKQDIRSNPTPYYNAMLQAMDTEIGRLLASLSVLDRKNTIVVFMGDNGSPSRVTRSLYRGNGSKGTIYDSGVNVPLVITGADVRAGRTDGFVAATDLFATIPAMAGVQTNAPDALDFRPLLMGGTATRDHIYVEHFSDRPARRGVFGWAMRMGDFKLLQQDGKPSALYNLSRDPYERKNLLSDGISAGEQTVVDKLLGQYRDIHGG